MRTTLRNKRKTTTKTTDKCNLSPRQTCHLTWSTLVLCKGRMGKKCIQSCKVVLPQESVFLYIYIFRANPLKRSELEAEKEEVTNKTFSEIPIQDLRAILNLNLNYKKLSRSVYLLKKFFVCSRFDSKLCWIILSFFKKTNKHKPVNIWLQSVHLQIWEIKKNINHPKRWGNPFAIMEN